MKHRLQANKLPPVSFVRETGETLKATRVVVLVEFEGGQIGYTSWGQTKALCGDTRKRADCAYAAMWPEAVGQA